MPDLIHDTTAQLVAVSVALFCTLIYLYFATGAPYDPTEDLGL